MLVPNTVYKAVAALNLDRYRLYRPRNYKVYLNVSESRMMFDRALGWYEPHMFESIGGFLRAGMTFVDVGCNKGDYSLFASHIVGPAGRVLSIEPGPENCEWIRRSIAANRTSNIELCELALSDQNGFADLHLGTRSGFHSLVTTTGPTVRVATATLDSLAAERNLRIDAVKIDVEGAELNVLMGMRESLRLHRPRVWVEYHPQYGVDVNQVRKLLRDLDYELAEQGNECDAQPRLVSQ